MSRSTTRSAARRDKRRTAPEEAEQTPIESDPADTNRTERRVYPRTPRTWEQWDAPLRQRVVGKRVVKWLRLRISRSRSSGGQ